MAQLIAPDTLQLRAGPSNVLVRCLTVESNAAVIEQ